MELWCGDRPHGHSGVLLKDCVINLVVMAPSAILLSVGSAFFLLSWCSHRSPCDVTNSPKWVRYPGHSLRWVLTFVLICLQVLEVTEGVLVQTLWASSPVLQLYVPGMVAVLAYCTSLLFYNLTETFNNPRWLTAGLLFWFAEVVVRVFKVASLHEEGFTFIHWRFLVSWMTLLVSLGLAIIDGYLLRSQRYLCKDAKLIQTSEDIQHLVYVHPHTNFLSHLTWHWLTPLLRLGFKKPLELNDLGKLPKTESSELNFRRFKEIFDDEKSKSKNSQVSLWKCYMRAYWPLLTVGGLHRLTAIIMILIGPICLDGMVLYVIEQTGKGNSTTTSYPAKRAMTNYEYLTNGYVLAILALLATLLQGTCLQNSFFICVRQGIRLKGAIQSMVYEKTLRLSLFSMGEGKLTQGQVINHMAVDPMHLFYLFYYIHFIWSLPTEVVLTFVMLYIQLGVSALVGASLLLLLVPAQYYIGQVLAVTKKAALEEADTRLKKSNELLQSIKLLKLYAWEGIFSRSIGETRAKELRLLLKVAFMRVLSIFITDGAPVAATMLTFVIYPYIENQPLKTGKVFSALAYFNILGLPLYLVTMIINVMTHSKVSTDRLTSFLMAPEIEGEDKKEPKMAECPPVQIVSPKKDLTDVKDDIKHDKMSENPLIEKKQIEQSLEISPDSIPLEKKMEVEEGNVLQVKQGHFSWDIAGSEAVLHNLNFSIPEGELTVLIGTVGSGKSSILSAVLGEMTTISGEVAWKSNVTVAYGGQRAWLMNATVQDNILFGRPFDKERYEKMLDICALRLDLDTLPAGDQTEIGEKGINLSGGQKQRISIARTIYSGADVVILDDPLSALDAHVGSHIFQSAIQEYLKDNKKTVVLVTHYLQYLSHAKQVLHVDNGEIAHQGSLEEIEKENPDIVNQWTSIIQENRNAADEAKQADGCPTIEIGPVSPTGLSPPRESLLDLQPRAGPSVYSLDYLGLHDDLESTMQLSRSRGSIVSANFPGLDQSQLIDKGKSVNPNEEHDIGKLIQAEEHSTGSVKLHVYLTYIKAATVVLSFMTVFTYCSRQALRMGTDYWLAEWSEASEADQRRKSANGNSTNPVSLSAVGQNLLTTVLPYLTAENETYVMEDYLLGFVYLCVSGIILTFGAIASLEMSCLYAAKNLHKSMLQTVIKAPMRFFDTTPIGRIVNRMSGDTNIIDEKMAVIGDGVLFSALYVLGGLIMNAVSTPFFLIPAIPIVAIYLLIQRFYIASSRELQRLDSITKSPILSHFSETLGGLSTIRAFRDQTRFETRNFKNIDTNNTAFLFLHTSNVWMGIRLDYLGAGIVFTASACSVTSGIYEIVSPGIVGLAVAYALMISQFVNWMMRTVSEAEMYFTSVERVSQFAELNTEPLSWDDKDDNLPDKWPSKGRIELRNVSLRYDAKLDPVINNISLTIKAGEKVGICGRTGSGKSSLTLGLFRMIDICGGSIVIDEIDVCRVSLHQLRARLSIIPQDPVLFEGSIRFNLDPEQRKSDEELWQALEIAQLKTTISTLPGKLDTMVNEGGENFSLGTRQLVCIARALLRHSQILIMDEATASIDMETDSVIQRVIQTAFADKTVITIAHRVATILKCDRIVVLADGDIMEADSPKNLLANPESIFASLVRDNK